MQRRCSRHRKVEEDHSVGGSSSHFAVDREVELRLLNPSSSGPSDEVSRWAEPSVEENVISQAAAKASSELNNYNKLVSKKKIVSPFKSVRRKDHSKKRIHIPNSPRRVPSPRRKSKAVKTKDNDPNDKDASPSASPSSHKPWRTNMKHQSSNRDSEALQPEDSCQSRIHRKSRVNLEEVKEYMKNKNSRLREESRREKTKSLLRKETIKNRLEDLEHKRKEKIVGVQSTPPKKRHFCPIHGYNNVGGHPEEELPRQGETSPSKGTIPKRSAVETLKEVHRNKLDNLLFLKLEELTRELDVKKKTRNLAPEPPEVTPPKNDSKQKTIEADERSSTQEKNRVNVEDRHKKQTIDRTTSPVQSLISKHEKDIDFVKKMDSNLLPQSLKSDDFNFISTVKRKLLNVEVNSEAPILSPRILPPPQGGEKAVSKTEDTLSEGLISTSLASYCKSSSSSIKACKSSSSSIKASKSSSRYHHRDSKSPPQKLNSDTLKSAMKLSSNEAAQSEPCAEFVPSALHLRFLAELNQLENVQSTEKHIDKLDRIRDISAVRQDAATMASIIKGFHGSKPPRVNKPNNKYTSKKESRAEFENRIRKEFNDLFQGSIQPLIQSQTEATRVTADATKMLASLHKNFLESELKNRSGGGPEKPLEEMNSEPSSTQSLPPKGESPALMPSSEGSRPSVNTIPEEVISLISKTESSIPEILSVLEKASRSGDSIRQTISEVMSRKNEEDSPSSSSSVTLNTNNITEEIENEILSPGEDPPSSSTPTRVLTQQSCCGDSSEFTLNMIERRIQVESSRASNQYLRLKLKEKKIVERAKSEISQLDAEKRALKSNNQDFSHISKRQKVIVATVSSQRKEIKALKEKLKAAERERQGVLRRQRAFLKEKRKNMTEQEVTSSESTLVPEDLTISKGLNIPEITSSPKVPRRVSESSEDSLTNVSQSSDHSDAAIRVNVLKDELQKQKSMAKKLREQQKIKKQENLKAQTESLKKQIESYDKLILRTREEINHQETSFEVMPPQIKTPVSKSRSSESEIRTALDDSESLEQDVLSSNKTSVSESIPTEIPSQEESNSALSSPPSSSSKASTVIPETHSAKKPPGEEVVDSVSSSILRSLMSDTLREYTSLKESPSPPKVTTTQSPPEEPQIKGFSRPQDLMLTTFGLDPEDELVVPPEQCPSKSVSVLDNDDGQDEGNPDNDFIDDDYGLSTIRKESEELLHQQMLIEEEINRIHEESSGVDEPPPPPYTKKTSNLHRTPAISTVPPHLISNRCNLEVIVPQMVAFIQKNPPELDRAPFYEDLIGHLQEASLYEEPTQFLEALFDTLVELRGELLSDSSQTTSQNPPWMKQKSLPRLRGPQNEAEVLLREALCLFGREKKCVKEALVLRSFKKKRSPVEELLAHELIGENEEEWSGYDAEETLLKDAMASSILKHLIRDTVNEMKRL